MILRTSYLNKLDAYRFCGLIKVIVGIRKCGKSTLMRQYIKKLQDENNDYNTIFINLNDFNTREKINNKKELNKYIEEKLLKDKKNFVFIDEVQEIPEFEIVLNSLSDHENVDIYVTGSNSKLLSSEISTLLTGKNIVINVYPLVFSELCNKTDNNIKEKFDDFFKYGGMPGRLKFTQEENIHEYLNMIYSDILRKDILARNKVFEISELTNIYYFIFDNLGKELSYKNIYEINKRNGCSLSQMSIIKYVELLLDCFLIQKVNKYDLSGLKLMENLYKYYPQDFGMRNAIFKNL
jgi:predicted AAA+ superfamily ATPase